MTRLLRTLLAAPVAALLAALPLLLGWSAPASATPAPAAGTCPAVSVRASSEAARAVFSGTVTAVERQPRTDGQPGAVYLQTVTVSRVYSGRVTTETVQVQTDQSRTDCSLGQLLTGTEYVFFVTGNGDPWYAAGTSGTRPAAPETVAAVERFLGEGKPPVEPEPEDATFTAVDTSSPRSFSRAAAPGAAMVLIGLLGLAVVRGLTRRSR